MKVVSSQWPVVSEASGLWSVVRFGFALCALLALRFELACRGAAAEEGSADRSAFGSISKRVGRY